MPLPSSQADSLPASAALTLAVANDLGALREASAAVRQFAAHEQLGERVAFKLDLVLEEMLMNRIEHAFAPGERRNTQVRLAVRPDAVVMEFEDDGVPFDPLQGPAPTAPTSLQEARVGGLGLLLTRKAARECRYERRAGRNVFTVVLERE